MGRNLIDVMSLQELATLNGTIAYTLADYLIMHELVMHTPPKNLLLHEQLMEPNRPLPANIRAHNG